MPSIVPPVVWGLIPSRACSRRLPGKALKPLLGKPLLQYTAEAVLQAPSLEKRWIFTNDADALNLACNLGLDRPPFERPESVSGDEADSLQTARYFLEQFPAEQRPDVLVLLQPTSPLRTAHDIEAALTIFLAAAETDYLLSVHKPLKPASWTYELTPSGHLQPTLPVGKDYVFPNGAIYIFRVTDLLSGRLQEGLAGRLAQFRLTPYLMPWERSLDVDYPVDLELAGYLLRQQQQAVAGTTLWQGDV